LRRLYLTFTGFPDLQAAAEAALSLAVETLAGGNLIHDLGYLESGLTFSPVQLLLCDEIVSWLKGYTREFEVNDRTLALDVIAEVGHGGQFLSTKHTREHFKERWYPNLFERANFDSWLEKGGKTLEERASDKIEQILGEHTPDPLPESIQKKLREIVETASTG
jgi:trimethylamine--corrinoid protein Co-methyltransferase